MADGVELMKIGCLTSWICIKILSRFSRNYMLQIYATSYYILQLQEKTE